MKRTISTFVCIIIFLFVILSCLDKSDYTIEKKLWRVQKRFDRIVRDPKVVPDHEFEDVVKRYKRITDQYSQSQYVSRVYLQIGRVYVIKRDFVKARETFQEILTRYPKDLALCAEVLLNIGATYENDNNILQAISVYRQIIADYPLTEIGINMPLYLARYYTKLKRFNESQEAFKEALDFYKKLSQENPQTPIDYMALRILVRTYIVQKDWEGALQTLEKLLLEFPSNPYLNPQSADTLIKSINTLSVAQLKNFDLPIQIYRKFIGQNTNHPLNEHLEKVIKELKKLKEKNLSASTKGE